MEAIEAVDFLGNPAFIRQVEGPRIDLPGDLTYNSIYREGQKFVYQAIDPGTNQTRICTFYIKLLGKWNLLVSYFVSADLNNASLNKTV